MAGCSCDRIDRSAFLAFLAFFQFGDQVDEYKTFSDAFESQVLMIFGEFLYTSNAGDRLSPPSQQSRQHLERIGGCWSSFPSQPESF